MDVEDDKTVHRLFLPDDMPGNIVLKVNLIEHGKNVTKENILPKVQNKKVPKQLELSATSFKEDRRPGEMKLLA
jgi:hypothetical protein